ncbi:hypothetical protein THAOC_04102 [Thalassiosira oceanica]|uniref:Uncharacterized protein n=1 Tax=Thalassiosira oceanica TaxID=159749 RepID=K0T657_THAOC|nr:hypothetical protein THAOC_04102 [Thalassiosira oceanica]|eukprot:EJK74233.1 hypothetical protein THAOC_04102 [Thalassiosira oceanica]
MLIFVNHPDNEPCLATCLCKRSAARNVERKKQRRRQNLHGNQRRKKKGTAGRLPLAGADTDDEGPREGDVSRLHDGVRRDVGRLARRDGQRAAPGGDHIDLPVGLLAPPREAVGGPDLARGGIPLVDEGVERIHRPVRREGTEAAGGVPRVLLLPDARLAYTAVLRDGRRCAASRGRPTSCERRERMAGKKVLMFSLKPPGGERVWTTALH